MCANRPHFIQRQRDQIIITHIQLISFDATNVLCIHIYRHQHIQHIAHVISRRHEQYETQTHRQCPIHMCMSVFACLRADVQAHSTQPRHDTTIRPYNFSMCAPLRTYEYNTYIMYAACSLAHISHVHMLACVCVCVFSPVCISERTDSFVFNSFRVCCERRTRRTQSVVVCFSYFFPFVLVFIPLHVCMFFGNQYQEGT